MTKLKVFSIVLIGMLFVLVSCVPAAAPTPPAPPKPEPERMPSVVSVIPNVGPPRQKVNCVGANFEPGEEVMVASLMFPDVETNLSGGAEGLTTTVNELGSFTIGTQLPLYPGVYPVRVYDKDMKVIASTVMLVEE